jgi:transglutaminase-like putative cysteine protease
MPAYGLKEFELTQTIRLYRTAPFLRTHTGAFSSAYFVEANQTQASDDICFRAKALRGGSKSVNETVRRIQQWLTDNVLYELNHEELGAQYAFVNRRGACDEQADLFVSMARCDGIAARRVTGTLLNASKLSGHAWAEYYDEGWVYLDPSVKDPMRAFAPDNRHIIACLGEGAYHCGVGYSYTYTGAKPKISVEEQVYMS